jgi:hypothetical protein
MHEGLHDDENRFFSSAGLLLPPFCPRKQRMVLLRRAGPGRAGRYAFDLISLCPDLLVQTISGVIPLYFSSDLTS